MTTTEPNLFWLNGVVSKETYRRLRSGERLSQDRAFRRVTLQLRKELGDTDEVRQILNAIKPIKQL